MFSKLLWSIYTCSERSKECFRLHTAVDPEDPENETILGTYFMFVAFRDFNNSGVAEEKEE